MIALISWLLGILGAALPASATTLLSPISANEARSIPIVSPTGLRPGDILLQPLHCWSCTLIEEEERTLYSHMGIVVSTEPTLQIAEAYGITRQVTLAEFDRKTQPQQSIRVLRVQSPALQKDFLDRADALKNYFQERFEGLPYDSDFLWQNRDSQGDELLYCSELVALLLHEFSGLIVPLKSMHFDQNEDFWWKYFKGPPPAGEPGLSPGDFERSPLFFHLGDLSKRST